MTFRELAQLIEVMTPEQKGQEVTVFDRTRLEFLPIVDLKVAKDGEYEELESGQPFIALD